MCEIKDVIQEPVKLIEFAGFKCCVVLDTYIQISKQDQERVAILLEDPDTGESIATATINMQYEILENDEVIIKNYSENEGMLSILIAAKIISIPLRLSRQGGFPICKLLLPLPSKRKSVGKDIFNAFNAANDFLQSLEDEPIITKQ